MSLVLAHGDVICAESGHDFASGDGCGNDGLEFLVGVLDFTIEDGTEEIVFAFEVGIEGAARIAGGFGDFFDGTAFDAVAEEDGEGGIEEAPAGLGAAFLACQTFTSDCFDCHTLRIQSRRLETKVAVECRNFEAASCCYKRRGRGGWLISTT